MSRKDVIVRLLADTDQFTKKMDIAARKWTAVGKKMEQTGRNMTMRLTAPIVALGALSVKAYAVQEQAIEKLNAQLRASGKDVEAVSKDYQKFAAELQKITVVGDETTIQLLQLAESMGSVDSKEATKGAIALSRALGVDLQSATKMAVLAQQGEYSMLQRYVPALREAGTETEKMAILQKLYADGMAIAEAETQTTTGQLMQLKNAVGDLSEEFGAIIAKNITPLIKKVRALTERISNMDDATKKNVIRWAALAAAIGPALWITGKVIVASAAAAKTFTALTRVIVLKTGAWKALNATMKANVIGLAVTAALAGVMAFRNLTRETGALEQITKSANKEIRVEQANLSSLFEQLKQTNSGTAEREGLIKRINDQYGTTIKNIKDEAQFMKDVSAAYDIANDRLKTRIMLQATEEKRVELIKKQIELEDKIAAAQQRRAAATDQLTEGQKFAGLSFLLADRAVERNSKSLSVNERELDRVTKQLASLNTAWGGTTTAIDSTTESISGSGGASDALIDLSTHLAQVEHRIKGLLASPVDMEDIVINVRPMSEDYLKATDAMIKKTEEWKEAVRGLNSMFTQFAAEGIATLAEAVGTAFSEGLGSGVDGMLDKLADFGKRLGQFFIAYGISVEAFTKTPFEGMSSIIAGAAMIAAATMIKSQINKVNEFALGTSFAPGGMALVGERGPELINLPRGSQVIPNMRVGNMMGGNMPNVVIRGNDLVLSFDRTQKRQRRYR